MVDSTVPEAGLHVLRAASLAGLIRAVGDELEQGPADPFTTQVVTVPGGGVQRWVAQQLSTRLGAASGGDGICAGVAFPTLAGLLAQITEDVSGIERGTNPWRPERALWEVLAELDSLAGVGWARYATHHLGSPGDPLRPGRRIAAARRIAALFQRYAEDRPDLVLAWSDGLDVDAQGEPLRAEDAWQPRVWRGVAARIGGPDPVRQRRAVCGALAAGSPLDLPGTVVVLAPGRCSPGTRELVAGLAVHRRVVVGLVDHAPGVDRARRDVGTPPATASRLAQHRLSRRLGREAVQTRDAWFVVADSDSVVEPDIERPATILGRLQHDIGADISRERGEQTRIDGPDGSLVLHASHGPDRQVEVLRDALLHLLAADPTLEPRDIVVLCPRLSAYAPLLQSAFAPMPEADANPGHRLRVRIADRSLKQLNPVLGVLGEVLGLVNTRLEASTLLDLAGLQPVATRLGLTDEDLERLGQLVERSGIRWGLDAAHRAEYGLAGLPQNTWVAGLDRMLAGIALTEDQLQPLGATVLPLDDVEAGDVNRIGRLAELVSLLAHFRRAAAGTHTATEWVSLLRDLLRSVTDARGDDAWQLSHAFAELAALADRVPAEGPQLGLGDVRVLLAGVLEGMPPRAGFGSGALVVCSPDQLRHVPHRVVALLGFDDAVFPRPSLIDGDDLAARVPLVGDDDVRGRDRQLLLDAVMAAQESLVLVLAGASPVTNEPIPHAVPFAELLDALDQIVALPGGARGALTVRHPLQPFAPAAFTDGWRSFDAGAAAGATALRSAQLPPKNRWPLVRLPDPTTPDVLELDELTRILRHPVKALLRDRGGLYAHDDEPDPGLDEIPLVLDGLQQWELGDRVLRLALQGIAVERAIAAEWLRGGMPPRELGRRVHERISSDVHSILAGVGVRGDVVDHDISLQVAGLPLRGRVRTEGDEIVEIAYSRPSAKHRLTGWLQLLALQAAEPEVSWRWRMVGKGRVARLAPVPPGWVEPVLANLVELSRLALVEPLPFLPRLAYAYAQAKASPHERWEHDFWRNKDLFGQEADEAFRRFFPSFDALRRSLPVSSDSPRHREPSRFATLALRVYQPLLRCEDPR